MLNVFFATYHRYWSNSGPFLVFYQYKAVMNHGRPRVTQLTTKDLPVRVIDLEEFQCYLDLSLKHFGSI
jgi:hypothetical protein